MQWSVRACNISCLPAVRLHYRHLLLLRLLAHFIQQLATRDGLLQCLLPLHPYLHVSSHATSRIVRGGGNFRASRSAEHLHLYDLDFIYSLLIRESLYLGEEGAHSVLEKDRHTAAALPTPSRPRQAKANNNCIRA